MKAILLALMLAQPLIAADPKPGDWAVESAAGTSAVRLAGENAKMVLLFEGSACKNAVVTFDQKLVIDQRGATRIILIADGEKLGLPCPIRDPFTIQLPPKEFDWLLSVAHQVIIEAIPQGGTKPIKAKFETAGYTVIRPR